MITLCCTSTGSKKELNATEVFLFCDEQCSPYNLKHIERSTVSFSFILVLKALRTDIKMLLGAYVCGETVSNSDASYKTLWESWELWFQDMDSFHLCRSTWVSPICRLRLSRNQKSMDEVGEFVWRPGVVTEALQRGRQVICLEKYFQKSTSVIFCQVASSRGCGQGAGRGKLGHRSRKLSSSNKWIL